MIIGRSNKVQCISAHSFRFTAQNMKVLIPSSGALHHILSPQFQRDTVFLVLFNSYFRFSNRNQLLKTFFIGFRVCRIRKSSFQKVKMYIGIILFRTFNNYYQVIYVIINDRENLRASKESVTST